MKKTLISLFALILIICMCGCENTIGNDDEFLTTDQTVSGGVSISDLNLSDISVDKNEYVEITFSFVKGSESAGQQETEISDAPEYYVSFCEHPTRLVLGIKNLKYWDYQQNTVISDPSGLVLGSFMVLPAGSRTYSQIYINLSSDVTFSVVEENGTIKVLLKETDSQTLQSYFVYGNLANEYYEGALDEEAGFTPTLTNDFSAVVMISRAFDTREAAEEFKAEIEEEYSYLLATKELSIFSGEANGNNLPPYTDADVMSELNNKVLINRNGINESFNVFLADVRPLCVSNDGQKVIVGRKELNGEYESEVMFVAKADGSMSKLIEYETTSVAMAMFSPDDKMLFYVEQIDGAMLASVYNFESNKLISIDEELLGTFISGAVWSSDANYIYFLSGEELPALKKYDVKAKSITSLTEEDMIESELYFSDNRLYFYSVDNDEEAIVRMNISNGQKEVLAKGEYFSMDRQGKNLIIKKSTYAQEGADTLTIYDIESKKENIIIDNVILGQYFFSIDGTKVYFTVDNTDEANFVQSLYCYDVNNGNCTELFKSVKAEIGVSFADDELLMHIVYDKDGVEYPATYKVKTNK